MKLKTSFLPAIPLAALFLNSCRLPAFDLTLSEELAGAGDLYEPSLSRNRDYVGFFGCMTSGRIENLTLENAEVINNGSSTGILLGHQESTLGILRKRHGRFGRILFLREYK